MPQKIAGAKDKMLQVLTAAAKIRCCRMPYSDRAHAACDVN
ncbi:hypothetical protein [Phyllobacterium myrsinacearum]|nr:hypothetical protein [Phyllobacterium myrsinacearum]